MMSFNWRRFYLKILEKLKDFKFVKSQLLQMFYKSL